MIGRRASTSWLRQLIRFMLGVSILLAAAGLGAQPADRLTGLLTATDGAPIGGATVLLLRAADTSYLSHTITNPAGAFTLLAPPASTACLLKASAIGYAPAYRALPPANVTTPFTVVLTAVINELSEVIVRERAPVSLRADTLRYRVADFRDSTERKVGDLLRKLPGVDVTDAGDVRVNGRPVRAMLIDGDDLMGGAYQAITNNLSADLVADVEVYFSYLDNPLLATFYDSEAVAVNLKTNQQGQRAFNGGATVGAGPPNRYIGDVNAVLLWGRLKMISFARLNNTVRSTARPPTSALDPTDFRAMALLGGAASTLLPTETIGGSSDPTRDGRQDFLSTTALLKLKNGWRSKSTATSLNDRFVQRNQTTFDYTNGAGLQAVVNSRTARRGVRRFGHQLRRHRAGKDRLTLDLGWLGNRAAADQRFGSVGKFTTQGRYDRAAARLQYVRKLDARSLLIGELNQEHQQQLANVFLSDSRDGIVSASGQLRDSLRQHQDYDYAVSQASLWLLRRQGRSRFILAAGGARRRSSYALSAPERTDATDFYRTEGFVHARADVGLGISTELKTTGQVGILAGRWYWQGSLAVEHEWSRLKNFRVALSRRQRPFDEVSALPGLRYRQRYQALRGDPTLLSRWSEQHGLELRYTTGKVLPYRSVELTALVSDYRQPFVPRFLFRDGTTLQSWSLFDRDRQLVRIGGRAEYLISPLSVTVKGSSSLTASRFTSLSERGLSRLRTLRRSHLLSVRTGLDLPVNLELGANYQRSRQSRREPDATRFLAATTTLFGDLNLRVGRFSGQWVNNYRTVRAGSVQERSYLADINCHYRLKRHGTRLGLSVHNLFDRRAIGYATVFEFGRITESSDLVGRYLLLEAEFSW